MNPLLFPVVTKVIDKIADMFPTEAARNEAKLRLLEAESKGDLEEIKVALSAILAEAQSPDPWTSRARPSFLYVIYIMLLSAIPMGLLSAYDSVIAANVALGFKAWLTAIPNELYALFGAGYLGYAGSRMMEKRSGKA